MPPRGYRQRAIRLSTPRLSHPPSPYQAAIYEFARAGTGNAFVEAVAGSGKCLGGDVEVLRYDGRVTRAKEIRAGDLLMGPDSLPRRVLTTAQGYGPLFKIAPVKGQPWICNENHILTLVQSPTGLVQDVALDHYMRFKTTREFTNSKLFRVGVDFPTRPPPQWDPYLIGIWLGDGARRGCVISSPEPEILAYLQDYLPQKGLIVTATPEAGCLRINISGGPRGTNRNPLWGHLTRDCVRGEEKYIPDEYLLSSRESRLRLLAGLLDTDGYLSSNCYEIIAKHRVLAEQIVFLARSLGLAAYLKERVGTIKDLGFSGTYHRIVISGHLDEVPCIVPRRKAGPRLQKKDVCRTGFRIEPLGEGDYYGFTLDGDGRFLLGDFTVTHNSTTLLGTLDWIPSSDSALCLAFNKSVKEHLATLTPRHVTVQTLNGYGHSLLCREFRGTVFVDPNRDRGLIQSFLKELGRHPYRYPNFLVTKTVCALVSLHKSNLATEVTTDSVGEAIEEFDLDVPPNSMALIVALTQKVFAVTTDRARLDASRPVVSYDDQLWMPVMWNMEFRQYDWVLVDEAQDLNRAQIELVMRAVRPEGRIIAFGDRKQAMYAFRGADANAVETLIQRMNAKLLPLSISYRCAQSVVRTAKGFVPQIEASTTAPEGRVIQVHSEPECWNYIDSLTREDMVLCRTNAPLMEVAEQLVDRGQSVRMADKSFADKLLSLMSIADREGLGGSLDERLYSYVKDEVKKREKDELPVGWLIDRAKSLRPFFKHGDTTDEVEDYIRTMFDSTEGPLFSTVHRAKGLEADRVFILRPDLMPHPRVRKDSAQYVQELNLMYVAITRARQELYFLSGIKHTEAAEPRTGNSAFDVVRVVAEEPHESVLEQAELADELDEAPF